MWLQEQGRLLEQIKGTEVDISGDARCDSPGYSAKYSTYSVHVQQINKIIHSIQVQLGEVYGLDAILVSLCFSGLR